MKINEEKRTIKDIIDELEQMDFYKEKAIEKLCRLNIRIKALRDECIEMEGDNEKKEC